MSARPFRALALTPLLLLLTGCGLLNLNNLLNENGVSTGSSVPNYTGNYSITGQPSSSGQPPAPVTGLVGAVSNSGATFTATFRLLTANQCVSPTQDIAFTGTSSASGDQITLSSTTLANNPISITWLDNPSQSSNGIGTYTITGSGPCAQAATDFLSDQYTALAGTYTGTFTSNGTIAQVTAVLTQGAADADGQFPETGSFTIQTPACTNNFTLTGTLTGPILTAVFNASAGGNLGGFTGAIPDHAETVAFPAGFTIAGSCNPGTFGGSLSLQ